MLAAISVALAPPTIRTQYPETLESEYPENERIWLINPNGLTKRQISQAYPRYQTNTSEGECLTSGLHSLSNWSIDSQWLAVEFGSYLEQIDSFISFINVHTDQHYEIKNAYRNGSWAPNQNTFALIENSQKKIILVVVEDTGLTISTFSYPSEMDRTVNFTNLVWTKENKINLVHGDRRALRQFKPAWDQRQHPCPDRSLA